MRTIRNSEPNMVWLVALLVLAGAFLDGACGSDRKEPVTRTKPQATAGAGTSAPNAEPTRARGPAEDEAGGEGSTKRPDKSVGIDDRIPNEDDLPPLPSGTFTGRFMGEDVAANLTLVIRDGVLTKSVAEVVGTTRTEMPLKPSVSSESRTIRLIGRHERDFLRLTGEFEDAERAAGSFSGTVSKKKVGGRWYVVRR